MTSDDSGRLTIPPKQIQCGRDTRNSGQRRKSPHSIYTYIDVFRRSHNYHTGLDPSGGDGNRTPTALTGIQVAVGIGWLVDGSHRISTTAQLRRTWKCRALGCVYPRGLRRSPHGSLKQIHHEEFADGDKERPTASSKIMLKQTDSGIQQ
jgi:hypothetical protein